MKQSRSQARILKYTKRNSSVCGDIPDASTKQTHDLYDMLSVRRPPVRLHSKQTSRKLSSRHQVDALPAHDRMTNSILPLNRVSGNRITRPSSRRPRKDLIPHKSISVASPRLCNLYITGKTIGAHRGSTMHPSSQPGQTELPIQSPTAASAGENQATHDCAQDSSISPESAVGAHQPTDLPSASLDPSPTPSPPSPAGKPIIRISLSTNPSPRHRGGERVPCCLDMIDPLPPTMTTGSLGELEIQAIFNNPKLRHDINYDPYLHFRPNVDGAKGLIKRQLTDAYWQMVTDTLLLFQSRGGCQSCHLPVQILETLFLNLRGILVTLLPPADQKLAHDCIDTTKILQELAHRVFRPADLLRWLGGLLKLHCAPMRDEEVNKMVWLALEADAKEDAMMLAKALRRCFDILEMMKLDVANHQIRSHRLTLVAETIDFHSVFYAKRIESDRLNPSLAKSWYKSARKTRSDEVEAPMSTFIKALTLLIAPSAETAQIPVTFESDVDRLDTSRLDLKEISCIRVCLFLFHDLRRQLHSPAPVPAPVLEALCDDLQDLLGDEDKEHRWTAAGAAHEHIAVFLLQRALALTGQTIDPTSDEHTRLIDFTALFLQNNLVSQTRFYLAVEHSVLVSIQKLALEMAARWTSPLDMAELLPQPGGARAAGVASRRTALRPFSRDMDVVARRIAQVSWLHWKVFAPLVYLPAELEEDEEEAEGSGREWNNGVPY